MNAWQSLIVPSAVATARNITEWLTKFPPPYGSGPLGRTCEDARWILRNESLSWQERAQALGPVVEYVRRRPNFGEPDARLLVELTQGRIAQRNDGPEINLGWTVVWQDKTILVSSYGKGWSYAQAVGEGKPAFLAERRNWQLQHGEDLASFVPPAERFAVVTCLSEGVGMAESRLVWHSQEALERRLPGLFEGIAL